jgi:hypothetical protein
MAGNWTHEMKATIRGSIVRVGLYLRDKSNTRVDFFDLNLSWSQETYDQVLAAKRAELLESAKLTAAQVMGA